MGKIKYSSIDELPDLNEPVVKVDPKTKEISQFKSVDDLPPIDAPEPAPAPAGGFKDSNVFGRRKMVPGGSTYNQTVNEIQNRTVLKPAFAPELNKAEDALHTKLGGKVASPDQAKDLEKNIVSERNNPAIQYEAGDAYLATLGMKPGEDVANFYQQKKDQLQKQRADAKHNYDAFYSNTVGASGSTSKENWNKLGAYQQHIDDLDEEQSTLEKYASLAHAKKVVASIPAPTNEAEMPAYLQAIGANVNKLEFPDAVQRHEQDNKGELWGPAKEVSDIRNYQNEAVGINAKRTDLIARMNEKQIDPAEFQSQMAALDKVESTSLDRYPAAKIKVYGQALGQIIDEQRGEDGVVKSAWNGIFRATPTEDEAKKAINTLKEKGATFTPAQENLFLKNPGLIQGTAVLPTYILKTAEGFNKMGAPLARLLGSETPESEAYGKAAMERFSAVNPNKQFEQPETIIDTNKGQTFLKPVENQKAGQLNWGYGTGQGVAGAMATVTNFIVANKAFGALAKAGGLGTTGETIASNVASNVALTYDDTIASAKTFTNNPAEQKAYALITGAIGGLLFAKLDPEGIVKKAFANPSKTTIDAFLSAIPKEGIEAMTPQAVGNFVFNTAKSAIANNLSASTILTANELKDVVVESLFNPQSASEHKFDITKTFAHNAIMFGPLSLLHGRGVAQEGKNRAEVINSAFEASKDVTAFQKDLQAAVQSGKIKPEDAAAKLDIVTKLAEIRNSKDLPKVLPENKQAEYAVNLLNEKQAEQQISELTDKVQIEPIKEEIATLQEERKQMLQPEAPKEEPIQNESASSTTAPSSEQQLKDVRDGNVVTFTYKSESEVPEVFKDKISSKGETNGEKFVRVTVAKSLADYELSKQEVKSSTTVSSEAGSVGVGGDVGVLKDGNGNVMGKGESKIIEVSPDGKQVKVDNVNGWHPIELFEVDRVKSTSNKLENLSEKDFDKLTPSQKVSLYKEHGITKEDGSPITEKDIENSPLQYSYDFMASSESGKWNSANSELESLVKDHRKAYSLYKMLIGDNFAGDNNTFKDIVDYINNKTDANIEYTDRMRRADETMSAEERQAAVDSYNKSAEGKTEDKVQKEKDILEEHGLADETEYSPHELVEKFPLKGVQKVIWDIIKPIVEKLGIKVKFSSSRITEGFDGSNNPMNGEILLRPSTLKNGRLGEVLVHEVVHSLTTKIISRVNSGVETGLTGKQVAAVKGLNKLYKSIEADNNLQNKYPVKDIFEFIAHLTNDSFVKELESKDRNFIQKVVDYISDILGLSNANELAKKYLKDIIHDGTFLEKEGITVVSSDYAANVKGAEGLTPKQRLLEAIKNNSKTTAEKYHDLKSKGIEKNLTEAESEVIGNEMLKAVEDEVQKLPENIQKQLISLLERYNEQGVINWDKMEEDSNGFDPEFLNLTPEATNYVEKLLKEKLHGQAEPGDVADKNESSPINEGQGNARQPEITGSEVEPEAVQPAEGQSTVQDKIKAFQAEYDKAVRKLETVQEKLSKENATQTDIFGNATAQKGMFEQSDAKDILDPLKAKVKEAKAALDKANKEAGVAADGNNPDIFPDEAIANKIDEKQQKDIVVKNGIPWGDTIKKIFTSNRGLPEYWMVLKDLATGERQLASRNMRKAIFKLQDAVKKTKYTDTDKISAALKDTSGTDFLSLPTEVQSAVKAMRLMVDGYSERLVNDNLVTPSQALIINDNIGEYLNRAYKLYTDKNWIKKVDDRVKRNAIQFLTQQRLVELSADPANAALTPAELLDKATQLGIQDATDILTKKDTPTGQRYTEQFSKDLSTLQKRTDIPEPIRKLMGEYTDPVTQFALTVSKMATLHSQAKLLNGLKDSFKGELFFEKDDVRPEGFNYKVADEGSGTWNPLNGLYTSKNVIDAIQESANTLPAWQAVYQKVFGTVKKLKTIYSIPTQVVNFFANPFISLANGHFNLGHLNKSWDYYKDTMFNKESGSDAILETLIQRNVIGQSVDLRQIRDMLRKDKADEFALEDFIKPKQSNWNPLTWAKEADKLMQKQYGASDSFWKVYGFMNEAANFSDALYDKKYKDLADDEKNKVDEMASERIKNTYPTYDRALPALMWVGKNIPFVGNFMAFQAEVLRTIKNNVLYVKEDLSSSNPKIKQMGAKRLAGLISYTALKQGMNYAAVLATGNAVSTLWAYAFQDDDKKSKRSSLDKFAPDFLQTHNLMVENAGPGKYTVYDIDRLDPYNAAWQSINALKVGKDGGGWRALREAAGPFIEPDMLLRAGMDINKNEDFQGKPIYNTAASEYAQFMQKMAYVYRVVEPTTAKMFKRAADAPSPTKEIAASLFGARSYTIDVQLTLKSKIREAEEKISSNGYFNYKDKEGKEKETMKSNFKKAVLELKDYYDSAIKLGVPPDEAETLIDNSFRMIGGARIIKDMVTTGNVDDADIEELYKKKDK